MIPMSEPSRDHSAGPTARLENDHLLRVLGAAVNQAKDSILITTALLDPPGPAIIFANPAFTAMTGYGEAEILGQTPRLFQGPQTDRAMLRRLRETIALGKNFLRGDCQLPQGRQRVLRRVGHLSGA